MHVIHNKLNKTKQSKILSRSTYISPTVTESLVTGYLLLLKIIVNNGQHIVCINKIICQRTGI